MPDDEERLPQFLRVDQHVIGTLYALVAMVKLLEKSGALDREALREDLTELWRQIRKGPHSGEWSRPITMLRDWLIELPPDLTDPYDDEEALARFGKDAAKKKGRKATVHPLRPRNK